MILHDFSFFSLAGSFVGNLYVNLLLTQIGKKILKQLMSSLVSDNTQFIVYRGIQFALSLHLTMLVAVDGE